MNEPSAIRALDIGIVTAEGERMLDFYTRVLGLEPAGEVSFAGLGVVHKLRWGASQVKLLVLERPAAQRNPGGGFTAASGLRYCCFTVDDIDAVVGSCQQYGCAVIASVRELRPGVRAAMVEDPDGNAIEFMQVA